MAGESRAASQVQFAIVVRARRVCLCRCEGRSGEYNVVAVIPLSVGVGEHWLVGCRLASLCSACNYHQHTQYAIKPSV